MHSYMYMRTLDGPEAHLLVVPFFCRRVHFLDGDFTSGALGMGYTQVCVCLCANLSLCICMCV